MLPSKKLCKKLSPIDQLSGNAAALCRPTRVDWIARRRAAQARTL